VGTNPSIPERGRCTIKTRKGSPKQDFFALEDRITVNYILPWEERRFITAAQHAAQRGSITIKGSIRGLYVNGDHRELAKAGLARSLTQDPSMGPVVRIARESAKIKSSMWLRHPNGDLTAEISVLDTAKKAKVLAQTLVRSGRVAQVIVYDGRGWPYKEMRGEDCGVRSTDSASK
jgi:hypothetical protein